MKWHEFSSVFCSQHAAHGHACLRFDGTSPPLELSVDDETPGHLVCLGRDLPTEALRLALWEWRQHISRLGPHGVVWSKWFEDQDKTIVGLGKLIPVESPSHPPSPAEGVPA